MESRSPPPVFHIEVDGRMYELGVAEFTGVLFDVVMTLVFEKLADRASYVLQGGESDLCGSGGDRFDTLCVSLYRHLKQMRCHGPEYPEYPGETQSFKLHSLKDGLVAVAFFLKAGETVPHFTVGRADHDVLVVLDRGARSRLTVEEPEIRDRLTRLIAE
jgi:hypothetical protein